MTGQVGHLHPSLFAYDVSTQSSEADVTHNYLDWFAHISWGQHPTGDYSIAHAKDLDDALGGW